MKRRVIIAAALIPFALSADTMYTITASHDQDCAESATCGSLVFELPQFNGTLGSVSYSFTDSETVYWGWTDVGLPLGSNASVSVTTGVDNSDFGFTTSATETYQSTLISYFDSSGMWQPMTPTLTASGTLDTGLGEFEGSGTIPISMDIWAQGSPVTIDGIVSPDDGSTIIRTVDYATLTVQYTQPIPEPRWMAAPVCFLILLRKPRTLIQRITGRVGIPQAHIDVSNRQVIGQSGCA